MIKSILSIIANLFRFGADRQEAVNTPEMKANVKARQEAQHRTEVTKAVAERDEDRIRRELAE